MRFATQVVVFDLNLKNGSSIEQPKLFLPVPLWSQSIALIRSLSFDAVVDEDLCIRIRSVAHELRVCSPKTSPSDDFDTQRCIIFQRVCSPSRIIECLIPIVVKIDSFLSPSQDRRVDRCLCIGSSQLSCSRSFRKPLHFHTGCDFLATLTR